MKTKGNPPKNRRVTVRLDNDTYQALEEAVKDGEIDSVSAELRQLIRWRTQSHEFRKTNEEDIKELKEGLKKHAPPFFSELEPKEQEMLKQDGYIHSMFLALAGLLRELIVEELHMRK